MKSVLQNNSEKATNKQVDQTWREVQENKQVKNLGRLSQILISVGEIRRLWAALKAGESLVLTYDGAMYKGHPNLEKLSKLQERYSDERYEQRFAKSDGDTAKASVGINNFSAHNKWEYQTYAVNPDGSRVRQGRVEEPPTPADEF